MGHTSNEVVGGGLALKKGGTGDLSSSKAYSESELSYIGHVDVYQVNQGLPSLLAGAPDFVSLALWMAIILAIASVYILIWQLLFRLQLIREQQIAETIQADWIQVFVAIKTGKSYSIPKISEGKKPFLLALWLEKREFATDRYAVDMDELADQLNFNLTILRLLQYQPMALFAHPARLIAIAIRAARWIETEDTRQALYAIAESGNYGQAIQACESLLYLGDKDSTRLVVQLLFRYPEHDKYTTTRLGHVGGERVIRVLDPFLEKLSKARLEDFVYLIEESGDKTLLPILVRLLGGSRTEEETASLLRAIGKIGGPAQRSLVLPYINSESTFVRLQAAAALATVGLPEDANLLLPLLTDAEWWVRYRAAQAYLELYEGSESMIAQIIATHTDKFARDILLHVNSERKWHRT